jgi:cell division protein FtsL
MNRTVIETAVAVGLLAAVIVTGVALVVSKNDARLMFQELELLKREEDRLVGDWSALRLEVHTLGSHSEIDRFARSELGMGEPDERVEYVVLPP